MSNDEPLTLRDVALAASQRNGGARGRALGRIAESKGLTLTYTTVDNILEGRYKSTPKAPTLEALAELSGYSLEEVYAAAKMPMPLKPLRDDLPPDADLLTGPQRRVIIDAVRLFAQQNRQLAALTSEQEEVMGNAEHPAAIKTPAPEPAYQSGSAIDPLAGSGAFLLLTLERLRDAGISAPREAWDLRTKLVHGGEVDSGQLREVIAHLESMLERSAREPAMQGAEAAYTSSPRTRGQRERDLIDATGEESQERPGADDGA